MHETKNVGVGRFGFMLLLACMAGWAGAATNTWNGPGTGGVWDKSKTNWDTSQVDPWSAENGSTNVARFNSAVTNTMSGTLYLNSLVLNARCVLNSTGNVTNFFGGSAPVILLDAGHPLGVNDATTSKLNLSGGLKGTNGLTIRSAGEANRRLILGGNNTNLLGGMHIEKGVNLLDIPALTALGGGDVWVNGAILSFNSGNMGDAKNRFHANGTFYGKNTTVITNSGDFDLTGNVLFQTGSSTYSYIVNLNGAVSGDPSAGMQVDVYAGYLSLAAANTYSGTTTVSSGYVLLKNGNAMQNSTLGGSPTNRIRFDASVASKAFVLGGLAARSGAIALTNTAGEAVSLLVGNNNASTTSGVSLTESGSLVKVGSGTLTLTNACTYTGATIVSNGTLAVNASGSLNSTNWTIASGAALSLGAAASLDGKSLKIDAGGAAAGLLSVAGNLTLGGVLEVLNTDQERRIAVCTSGAIGGTFASVSLPRGMRLVSVGTNELWAKPVRGTMIRVF